MFSKKSEGFIKLGNKKGGATDLTPQISALGMISTNIMIADADLNIIYVNDALREFMSIVEADIKKELPQFDLDNIIGQNIDIFHKNPAHQRGMLKNLPTNFKTNIQIGEHIFGLIANPLTNDKGERIGTVVQWEDATILDNAGQVDAINRSQAVIHFKPDGTILHANENFCKTMGYSLNEIVGKHHSMFAEPGVSETPEYKKMWEDLRAGQFESGQYKRIGNGGREIWIEASYNPIFDMNGKVFKVTKFATDLTPRKEENAELANNFESNVQSLVQDVASSATQLQGTSQALAAAAEETSTQSNTVAAATEELSASVNEISSQVTNSVTVVNEAVDEAKKSEELVSSLVEAAQRIGEVTALINDIAEQTNLLALNATIEAARAGDAGKGFAVVASEVKKLASETAKATEEISSQIGGIQSVSQNTADAIQNIIEVINKVSEISTVISGAVEEQSAATQEVASNIVGVQSAANETGQSSSVMSEVSNGLSSRSDDLQSRVNEFLSKVRSM